MSSLKNKLAQHKAKKAANVHSGPKVDHVTELLGADGQADITELVAEAKASGRLIALPATRFRPDPKQPRRSFDAKALAHLQADIEAIGQLQPIVVYPADAEGMHQIIVGERRWRAVNASATVSTLDAVILHRALDELRVLRMQIQENSNREGVNALEHAASIVRGVSLCKDQQAAVDDKAAAAMLGISASSISKARGLLKAPQTVKALSEDGILQDTDTLYQLAKAHKKDGSATEALVGAIRDNTVAGNLRKAAQRLDADLKRQQPPRSKTKAPKTPAAPAANVATASPRPDGLPEVEGVSFALDGDKTVISFTVADTQQRFVLSTAAMASLAAKFSDPSEP